MEILALDNNSCSRPGVMSKRWSSSCFGRNSKKAVSNFFGKNSSTLHRLISSRLPPAESSQPRPPVLPKKSLRFSGNTTETSLSVISEDSQKNKILKKQTPVPRCQWRLSMKANYLYKYGHGIQILQILRWKLKERRVWWTGGNRTRATQNCRPMALRLLKVFMLKPIE